MYIHMYTIIYTNTVHEWELFDEQKAVGCVWLCGVLCVYLYIYTQTHTWCGRRCVRCGAKYIITHFNANGNSTSKYLRGITRIPQPPRCHQTFVAAAAAASLLLLVNLRWLLHCFEGDRRQCVRPCISAHGTCTVAICCMHGAFSSFRSRILLKYASHTYTHATCSLLAFKYVFSTVSADQTKRT